MHPLSGHVTASLFKCLPASVRDAVALDRRYRQSIREAAHDFAILEAAHLVGRERYMMRPVVAQVGAGYFALAPCHEQQSAPTPRIGAALVSVPIPQN